MNRELKKKENLIQLLEISIERKNHSINELNTILNNKAEEMILLRKENYKLKKGKEEKLPKFLFYEEDNF